MKQNALSSSKRVYAVCIYKDVLNKCVTHLSTYNCHGNLENQQTQHNFVNYVIWIKSVSNLKDVLRYANWWQLYLYPTGKAEIIIIVDIVTIYKQPKLTKKWIGKCIVLTVTNKVNMSSCCFPHACYVSWRLSRFTCKLFYNSKLLLGKHL